MLRRTAALWGVALNSMVGVGLFLPAIAILDQYSDLSLFEIGLLAGAFPLAEGAAALAYPPLVRKLSPRAMLLIGQILCAIGAATLIFTLDFWILLAGRILGGVGGASVSVAQYIVGVEHEGNERVTKIGQLGSMQPLGFMIGLLSMAIASIVFVDVDALGWAASFATILAILAAILVWSTTDWPKMVSKPTVGRFSKALPKAALALYSLNAFFYIGLAVQTSIWAGRTAGVGSTGASLIFLALAAVAVVSQAKLVGYVVKKLETKGTVFFGFSLSTIGASLFALNSGVASTIAGLLLARIGFALIVPPLLSKILGDGADAKMENRASLAMVAASLGSFAGPVLTSVIRDEAGMLSTGLMLIAAAAIGMIFTADGFRQLIGMTKPKPKPR